MKLEITEMQQQKIQLQKEKEDLMAELEAIKSLTRIEEEALVKLGMDYPTEDQVVYISVDDCHWMMRKLVSPLKNTIC